jgi:D-aspartate ligase
MKKINVLIPDGDDQRAIKVVQSLGISGKTRIFILTTRNNVVKYSRFCSPFFISENAGNNEMNACMEHVLKRYSIDLLLPVAEKGIAYIHHNDWLKKWNIAPIPDLTLINKAGDKDKLNNISKSLGMETLPSIIISKKSEIDRISNINNYPVLIKPAKGAGGYGIIYVKDRKTLLDHITNLLIYNRNRKYIIQEYVDGSDMDISILCHRGEILAYTIQKPIHKAKNIFTFAKMIRFLKNSEILEYCRKLVAYIKWNGVAHLDFIKEKSGEKLYLIDFNPRYWGTLLGSTCAGVNFPYLACLSAMGVNYPVPNYDQIEYFELDRIQMLSLIFGKKEKKIASMRNSTLYLSLLDPMPTIMKRPAIFR